MALERLSLSVEMEGHKIWCRGPESNWLRPPFQGGALPMSYPGIFCSFSILGALTSRVNSARAAVRDEVRHDADKESNHAEEASPAAAGDAERWLGEEGYG